MFMVVEEAIGESAEWARTFWTEDPVLVQLEYAPLQLAGVGNPQNVINHEAGHAYFWASHEGTPGIMNDFDSSRIEWPNDEDIQSVIDWLGPPESPGTGKGGALWFPGNLPHYFTKWPIGAARDVRLTATVLEGVTGTSLKAVWGRSFEAMKEGRFHDLTPVVATASRGLFASEWQSIPTTAREADDVCVGIVVRKATADIDIQDLIVGLAEVQVR